MHPSFRNNVSSDLKFLHSLSLCAVMEDLQIHHVLCSKAELSTLKGAGVIPPAEDESALITKTDAERLVSYFKTLDNNSQESSKEKLQGTPAIGVK